MITSCIPVESFFDPLLAKAFWPESVADNPAFLDQIEKRQLLIHCIKNACDYLPKPDCTTQELMTGLFQDEAIEMYSLLADLLESGPEYRRIVLYLPFEFLPDQTTSRLKRGVQTAALRFKRVYMAAWHELLETHDVRANFVDGDVTEEDQAIGLAPRVVKAAHLIPKLVERGLLKVEEVIILIEQSNDSVLKNSIADTLPVLADLEFLDEPELRRMKTSPDRLVKNMAIILASNAEKSKRVATTTTEPITLAFAQDALAVKSSWMNADSETDITPRRKIWLKEKRKQETLEEIGKAIAAAIANEKMTDESITEFCNPETDILSQQTLVEGIRIAIESTAVINIRISLTLCKRYENILLRLWQNSDEDVKELVVRTLRRFHRLGVFGGNRLERMGINIPDLAGSLNIHLSRMRQEIRELQQITETIKADQELSQMIYPVVIISGSRLNGYAGSKADIDIAILVRPGIPFAERPKLHKLLGRAFTHQDIHSDDIKEFWLNTNGDHLLVREFDGFDVRIAPQYWTHILFGAAWIGEENILRELFARLLVPYLSNSADLIMKRQARGLCLEDMEQGTLQYRLMHKGYDRFFPPYGGIHTPNADCIDGESMFWDCGFRQIATELFCRRVFIPKLEIEKNQTN